MGCLHAHTHAHTAGLGYRFPDVGYYWSRADGPGVHEGLNNVCAESGFSGTVTITVSTRGKEACSVHKIRAFIQTTLFFSVVNI